MTRYYLENRGVQDGGECNKFIEIVDDGTKAFRRWGSIGSAGRGPADISVDPDPVVRAAAVKKFLKSKTQRKDNPYQIIETSEGEAPTERVEARPPSEGRKFGLEVETHTQVDLDSIISQLRDRGLTVNDQRRNYFHSDGQGWDVKRDSSCGYEFASPILSGEAGIFDAKLAVEKIRDVCVNACNSSCGLHVTVGIEDHSDEDIKRLVIAYLRAQDHFYAECNPARANNHFCKKNPTSQLDRIINARSANDAMRLAGGFEGHGDRYHGMNWTRVRSRKCIEFRMMEGTVAIRKVGAWIRMCVGFVDGVKASGARFKSTTPFSADTFQAICSSQWRP